MKTLKYSEILIIKMEPSYNSRKSKNEKKLKRRNRVYKRGGKFRSIKL